MMMIEPAHDASCGEGTSELHITCETSSSCVSRCAAYGKVCPLNARAAGRAVRKKMESILANSEVFKDGYPQFHTIDSSDIIMGGKLGEGGFSFVNACSIKDSPHHHRLDDSSVIEVVKGEESCAVKYLKRRIMVEEKTFVSGAADLATEALFLARLSHPNIIKLRAITAGSVESNISSGKDAGFFIIVDRLTETLEKRIERWRSEVDAMPSNIFYRLSKEYKDNHKCMLRKRLEYALEIAEVMEYLHGLNVIFRDLKPENIGFDRNGVLKLFDFGLAREEKACEAIENGTYKMTGHTGSRRYMAPEVASDLPYNKAVDVYSFAILLWELCSLEKPFQGYSSQKHLKDVIIGGERPKMDYAHTALWPVSLQWLMKCGWSADASKRPSFTTIRETLEAVLKELCPFKKDHTRAMSEGHFDRDDLCYSPKMKKPRHWKMGFKGSRS